ncbi:MAG: transcription antitermination factor NusB [Propionibacteriaceae bacterium]|nr:transcription antitermination factor NusB [Propionibacteriaceae bacterium]
MPAGAPPGSGPTADRPHRSGRRKARKYALDLLFAADLRQVDPMALAAQNMVTTDAALPAYSRQLVEAVADHQPELDQTIARCLKPGWSIARMPAVDRSLARLAVAEATWLSVPPGVVISEAAALARELSTDESPQFLSGLLGAILLTAEPTTTPGDAEPTTGPGGTEPA